VPWEFFEWICKLYGNSICFISSSNLTWETSRQDYWVLFYLENFAIALIECVSCLRLIWGGYVAWRHNTCSCSILSAVDSCADLRRICSVKTQHLFLQYSERSGFLCRSWLCFHASLSKRQAWFGHNRKVFSLADLNRGTSINEIIMWSDTGNKFFFADHYSCVMAC
jgi:hypothetical protein